MGIIRNMCNMFRSTFEGLQRLEPLQRLEAYEAIQRYAFYDEYPEFEKLMPTTELAFRGCELAIDKSKERYDAQIKCGEFGKLGAEFGKLGGRGNKKTPESGKNDTDKTPENPPGGKTETPENPQEKEKEKEEENLPPHISPPANQTPPPFSGQKPPVGGVCVFLNGYSQNGELTEALNGFAKMRQLNKKPLTERAVKMLTARLDELFGANNAEKIAALNRSVYYGWQDVYPPNERGAAVTGGGAGAAGNAATRQEYEDGEVKELLAKLDGEV